MTHELSIALLYFFSTLAGSFMGAHLAAWDMARRKRRWKEQIAREDAEFDAAR